MRIIEQINQYLVNPHTIDKRARFSHYPSEASIISRIDNSTIGKCHRASWYNWLGYEPTNPVDQRAEWTFEVANRLEGAYIEFCKRIGIWAGNNVKFYDREHNVSGEADIFIFEPIPQDQWKDRTPVNEINGVEVKTAYGYGFQKQVKEGPKIENLLQVALYLDYFGCPRWHLIYKARDTMEDTEYIITMAQDKNGKYICVDGVPVRIFYLQDIYDRYNVLGQHVINKTLPDRDYTYGYSPEQSEWRAKNGLITKSKYAAVKAGKVTDSDWQCLYCSHLDRCWEQKRKGGNNGKGVVPKVQAESGSSQGKA